MVDHPGGERTRLRYVGLTTNVAQWLDDGAGTVTRSVANGWTGERLADWTGSGSNLRIYGTNGHHDVTWLATNTGAVSQALRSDAWGNPRATVPAGYSPFRFQGSWFDDAACSAHPRTMAGRPRGRSPSGPGRSALPAPPPRTRR